MNSQARWGRAFKRAVVAIVSATLGHFYIDLVAPHAPVPRLVFIARTALWCLVIFLALIWLFHWENGKDKSNGNGDEDQFG
jgi:hypothetical protein